MNAPHIATRTPLSRRIFLKAAGATLALPFLEGMLPRRGAATPAPAPPRRFVGMMTNMGIMPEFFFPKTAGAGYENTPYLDLMKEHRAETTVFSGVSLPGVDGGHAAEFCFLTGAPGASRGSFQNSVSLDQVMAEQVGTATRFPSLTLGLRENTSLSWTRSGAMIPTLRSPLKLYQKLFIEDSPEEKAAAVRRLREDRSLLDELRGQYTALQRAVSAADRDRLEQFAMAIRDLEKRLAAIEGWVNVPKPKIEAQRPEEINDENDLPKNSRVMLDMIRLALETDSTRVVTLCWSLAALTPTTIPGVKSECHALTHHGQRPEAVHQLKLIEESIFKSLNTFFTGMKASREQGASLLDRTACLFGTNMGSANAHSNDNLPALLAGGGFKHGQHLAFDRKKNHNLATLYVSLLQRMNIEAGAFASAKSTMTGLEMV